MKNMYGTIPKSWRHVKNALTGKRGWKSAAENVSKNACRRILSRKAELKNKKVEQLRGI